MEKRWQNRGLGERSSNLLTALRRVNSKGAVMAGGLTKVAQVNDRYPHKYIKTQYKAQVRIQLYHTEPTHTCLPC